MLNRRSFLINAGAISLASLLSGCGQSKAALKVLLLESSIPPQLPSKFRSSLAQNQTISFKPEAQLEQLYRLLKTWHQPQEVESKNRFGLPLITLNKTPALPNLITLGDSWLAEAIQQQLIQPLNVEKLSGWRNLPPRWQELVRRNEQGYPEEKGQVWGAPYRWGSTIIAYRSDKFRSLGWEPMDWSDLWRQELRDRLSLLDQPREVIGLTLKKLGYSYNERDLNKIPPLKSELKALNKQVKFYSSQNYLQPLILGDTWLAVGWSADILPLQARYSNIKAIIPRSGTALWTDLWVQPNPSPSNALGKTQENFSVLQQWIDFCWQPKPAQQISLFTEAASPAILTMAAEKLPQEIRDNHLLLVEPQILSKSEFLLPLPPETRLQYQALWREMRIVH